MSNTLRTDTLLITHDMSPEPKVLIKHARALERMLNNADTRIKRLEKAGDRLLTVMRGEEGTAYCEWVGLAHDAEQNWIKVRRNKP